MSEIIAVAVDGSENAMRAVDYATKLTAAMKGKLLIVSVLDMEKLRGVHFPIATEELIERQKEVLTPARERAQAQRLVHEVHMLRGTPAVELIDFAKEHQVTHFVLGSRGLNAFEEFMLGSVSHKVIQKASCPVTIIK